jgi:hypothetical protein
VAKAADALGRLGDALARESGGVDRGIPAVPEDEHGVGAALVAFDEARETFERQLGEALSSVRSSVAATVRDVHAANRPVDGDALAQAIGRMTVVER